VEGYLREIFAKKACDIIAYNYCLSLNKGLPVKKNCDLTQVTIFYYFYYKKIIISVLQHSLACKFSEVCAED
jgi:hypothetical protein